MSGIVGIVQMGGGLIDRPLLGQLTEFLKDRGPDAQGIWEGEGVGLGHTLLATTLEAWQEKQPLTLEQQVWITADTRLDDRPRLLEQLATVGERVPPNTPDGELILRAYRAWGTQCVQYLLGDFSFAIWDGRQQRLFCGRDPFGVKPFYYACWEDTLIFSNTLNCLRLHPRISGQLNERAIADVLLFDYNQEPGTTLFSDIQRLPPGHVLTFSRAGLEVDRSWSLPQDGCIRYRDPNEYVAHFRHLLGQAVGDRLRTDRVAVMMSGGLDSTTIAATAQSLLARNPQAELQAYTWVYDHLVPDQERYYSQLAAKALGIGITHCPLDDYRPFARHDRRSPQPEPITSPLRACLVSLLAQVASRFRVLLDGHGGDPVLYASNRYVFQLLQQGQLGDVLAGGWRYFRTRRRLPAIGLQTFLRRQWRKQRGTVRPIPPFPTWLNPEFVARWHLKDRWEWFHTQPADLHPTRPEAYRVLSALARLSPFEDLDPAATEALVEVRHPFFDMRLVSYLLAIPPFPWCVQKYLLRLAMQDLLPQEILTRPKTTLGGDPIHALLTQSGKAWLNDYQYPARMYNYVKPDHLHTVRGGTPAQLWANLRPIGLAEWIYQFESFNRFSPSI